MLHFRPPGPGHPWQAEMVGRRTKRVWFLVCPGTGVLDIAGPWEVLGHANEVLGRSAYELELVGPRGPAVETRHGLVVAGVRNLPRAGALSAPHCFPERLGSASVEPSRTELLSEHGSWRCNPRPRG